MDVLVIGGGGREHALCWGLKKSPQVGKLYCVPGNPGIAKIADCVELKLSDLDKIAAFAQEKGIKFVVIGPEAPLCDGLTDLLRKQGIDVFGPSAAAAQLEGSKDFSKSFMVRYGIPTAIHKTFTDKASASNYVSKMFSAGVKLVVKADGLAAGKGVIVADTEDEALKAVEECFAGAFGKAGAKVVLEERLEGEEASILALTDGKTILPLVSSQDHKRLLDDDKGPNTGGMGAYSPAPVVDAKLMAEVERLVLKPFLKGIQAEKLDYRGLIYAGVMVTKRGPMVLEFNVRFGDPETQAIIPRLDSDLFDALYKTACGKLSEAKLKWSDNPAVCIVMASGGYPGSFAKGNPIEGLDAAEASGATVFHAGTALKDGKIVNNGGRVLGVTATATDVRSAIAKAYEAVKLITWKDAAYRKDIAKRALVRPK